MTEIYHNSEIDGRFIITDDFSTDLFRDANREEMLQILLKRFIIRCTRLARLTRELIANRGSISDEVLENFFKTGYTKENLIDVIVGAGEKSITNLLHNVTDVPIDFPEAPELSGRMYVAEAFEDNESQSH